MGAVLSHKAEHNSLLSKTGNTDRILAADGLGFLSVAYTVCHTSCLSPWRVIRSPIPDFVSALPAVGSLSSRRWGTGRMR